MSATPPPSDRRALLREALEAVEQMQAKLDAERRRGSEPIAIVGMACRFPGAVTTPEAYWALLSHGVDAVSEVPAERWDEATRARLARGVDGKPLVHYGGFLADIDRFDPKFFGISPREAMTMDPQQRLVLEVAWEALERAGQAPDRLAGSATGVFLGITTGDYADLVKAAGPEALDVYMATGNAHNAAAGRVSYVLGLNGPSMAVDTACSSSLVAVHLACQSLRTGESRLALAGGVNVILTPDPFVIFSRWGMMAPDGRCKTFDGRADGFVRSEGCGIVALKRLSEAQADGDEILAVIRGSAVNQDGASSGLTVPNGLAQQAVVRQALRVAGVEPNDVSYVEAHGTGTALGDPIELEALDAVFGTARPPDRPLVLGSVKTNLGHLESASGVAGLMKVVLALRHGVIPPHLHFTSLTPRVSLRGPTPVVPTSALPWPAVEGPRLAGVSAFGFSGTNAHVVLEAAPPSSPVTPRPSDRPVHVLALSARSEPALDDLARRYAERLGSLSGEGLADVCFSAGVGRAHMPHRLAVPAAGAEQAIAALRAARAKPARRRSADAARPRVAFLFSGQGSQYAGMGRQLYEACAPFRRALDRCAELLDGVLDRPLLEVLYPGEGRPSPIDQTAYTQPALFALEYALAETWRAWGVVPSAVLGHSVGEYVAACVAGVWRLEDALALIAIRGRLMQALPAGGAMAAVFASEGRVADAVRGSSGLAIAAVNAPDNVVVSGMSAELEALIARLGSDGIEARRLAVSHAFHSPLMDPILDEFTATVARCDRAAPRIGLVSNLTGRLASARELGSPEYWRRHLREPVRFAAGLETLRAQGIDAFVEIGPSPALLGIGRRVLGDAAGAWMASLRPGRGDWEQMLEGLAALYTAGVDVDWAAFDQPYRRRRVSVPTYPFQRERYWVEARPAPPAPASDRPAAGHPLLGRRVELAGVAGTRVWEQVVSLTALPFVADHRVEGRVIVPATAYLEMMLSAGAQSLGDGPLRLSEIQLEKPVFLEPETAYRLQLSLAHRSDDAAVVRIHGRQASATGTDWVLHVSGAVSRDRTAAPVAGVDVDAIRRRCGASVSGAEFYERLAERGNEWGPAFRGVTRLWQGAGEALSEIGVPSGIAAELGSYLIHPAVADASGHVLAATIPLQKSDGEKGGAFVGGGIDRITLHRRPVAGPLLAYAVRRPAPDGPPNILSGDVTLMDEVGVVAELTGARLWYLDDGAGATPAGRGDDWLCAVEWRSTPRLAAPAEPSARLRCLVLADRQGVGDALADGLEAAGHDPLNVHAGPHAADLAAVVDAWLADSDGPARVIHLWSLDGPSSADTTADGLAMAWSVGPASVLRLTQALARPGRPAPRLWLVTRGAQPAGPEGDVSAVAPAPLWGFGRALATEHPELWGGLVDLDPGAAVEESVAALLADVTQPDGEDQLAYRLGVRYAARLVRDPEAASDVPVGACRADATYLVTGGLGGLGLLVAGKLAELGARRLVLIGRSAIPARHTWSTLPAGSRWARIAAEVERLEGSGVAVRLEALDVADEPGLRGLLARLDREGWPAVRGVVHAAGMVRYASILDSTEEELDTVAHAKVVGAWRLHMVLEKAPLDFFVLFSSASAVLASPMVAAYAGANAFLDALAHHRRARGLPALSIDWGLWGGVGMAEGLGAADLATLVARGMGTIDVPRGFDLFARLLGSGRAQVAVLPVNWRRWRELYPAFTASRFLEGVVPPEGGSRVDASGSPALRATLLAASPEERVTRLRDYLLGRVAEVLRITVTELDPAEPLGTLGLDSLMALELRSRVEADTGISVPMVRLLQGPSVDALAAELAGRTGDTPPGASARPDRAAAEGDESNLLAHVVAQRPAGADSPHPLSYGQQALWFLHHLAPESDAYNVLFTARIRQTVDLDRLQGALTALTTRHPMLRTTFALGPAGPVQQAGPPDVTIERENVAGLDAIQLRERVTAFARRPLDLARGPVMRVTLFSQAPDAHVLLISVHHIATDAWSFEILLGELRELLAAAAEGRPARLAPTSVEYIDFARWQTERVGGAAGRRERAYWETKLAGELPVLRLPFASTRGERPASRGAAQEFVIEADLAGRLRQVARGAGATLYMLLLSAYALLLRRVGGQDEVIVGSPVSGRQRREFAPVIGYFVNMVPMRLRARGADRFAALLDHTRTEALEAFDHQDYPFALMVKELTGSRDASRTPVFQAVFNFIRSEDSGALAQFFVADGTSGRLDLGGLVLEPYPVPQQEGQFELVLEMTESAGTLHGRFKCDTEVFAPGTVRRLARGFTGLLQAIAGRPDATIAELAAAIEAVAGPAGVDREEIDL
jgi:acyl transferase domain-containing protein/acyl carrier protein